MDWVTIDPMKEKGAQSLLPAFTGRGNLETIGGHIESYPKRLADR